MKVLVTGATGVVGRRLVPLLRRDGHEVTAIARSPEARATLRRTGVESRDLDLFDASAVHEAVAGHDAVVNLATHIPRSSVRMLLPWAWRENDRLRRDASALLVDAALAGGVTRFVQESFAPAYPDMGDRWIDEEVELDPAPYGRSIVDAEASARRFAESGRAGVVLRFGAFYGPDAFQTRDLVAWVRRGWAPLVGPPDAWISSVSHADAATATVESLGLPAGTYNVVDDEPLTHREYVDSLATQLHVPSPRFPPRWVESLLGSIGEMLARSVRISNRKLRSMSRWVPGNPSVRDAWPDLARAAHKHWRFSPRASIG